MQFKNGFWGSYARQRGTTIWRVARTLALQRGAQPGPVRIMSLRRTIYRFLDGDDKRLGRPAQEQLARAFGVSRQKLLQVRKIKGKNP